MQLTIPAQDNDSPGTRIRPREVRDWLDNLPWLDVQRAARLVNEQLRLMNRQLVAPAARLEILGEFLRTYLRLLESLPVNASEAAALRPLLKQLSQNIGFGYKIVVHELANGKSGLLEARHLPAALLGAIHTLGLQLMHYYAGFQRAPFALWNECLAIYRYARNNGRGGWQGKLPGVGTLGIDDAFRLIALLRLADPYRLPAGAVRGLESYFRDRIALAVIEADPSDAGAEPLLPLHRTGLSTDNADIVPLFLDPTALMERMAADIRKLEQAKSTRALELPELVAAPVLASALQQVLRHWTSRTAQRTKREVAVARIELVSGLDAAYCALNKGRPFDPGLFLGAAQDNVIDIGVHAAPEPSARRLLEPLLCNSGDRSIGGLSVSYRGDRTLPLHVGQLFALRRAAPSGGAWVIAACRWLTAPESAAGFDMGLQYLAREPEAVVVRSLDAAGTGGEYHPAIGAVQKRGEQQVHTLIVRGGEFTPGSELLMYGANGQPRKARCTELLESGHGFDRLICQPVD